MSKGVVLEYTVWYVVDIGIWGSGGVALLILYLDTGLN